uniref:Uncharacterized protein n=1 Tax=Timema cristinae TaxID=61476 RepID=A0A7R9CRZ6_TIMCR|nr:unnamed protein product [Timema cristinae]
MATGVTTACRLSEVVVSPDAGVIYDFALSLFLVGKCVRSFDLALKQTQGDLSLRNKHQVVICGAVPSMVRSVRLYNQCSSNTIRVNMNGTVFASDSIPEKFQDKVVDSKLLDMKKRHGPSDRHELDHVIDNQPVDKMKTIIWKAGWVKWPTRLGPTARQAHV